MEFPSGTILIEVRGIYDGWSIAKLPSGALVNRWPEDDRRHAATQEVIEKMNEEQQP